MKKFFLFFIRIYQKILSPWVGQGCRFYPTCSTYAYECFERFSIGKAIFKTLGRLAKCHPFHPGGFDPVELSTHCG
ncbi:MAG: membrane protein insertion efficiency factor YidD [Deltaproteobacteria bacterium]|nr:membrane protein insertion efficiency factor YidD [Deltaproteobacteria bacterium]